MASKSKKRRRVLGASCILAALIVAGSSFAWFTSKDEVTNRLSASADYNVSIIENFVPPKQWVPGQTVTKEEAVVNTGSVDAFVKQTVSGVLTVAVEIPTDISPADATPEILNDYLTLDKQTEWGTIEAGSYLAWAPDGSKYKKENGIIMDYGITGTPDEDDFDPDVNGLYIFRRAVDVDQDGKDTAYEYVGYYYKDGTYYKIYWIDPTSLELVKDAAGNPVNGNLAKAPTVKYSKKIVKTMNKTEMEYDGTAGKERLIATFNAGNSVDTSALANLDTQAYAYYRQYVDAADGRTKWAASTGQNSTVYDPGNLTGLTNKDVFDSANSSVTAPATDLSNYSYNRANALSEELSGLIDANGYAAATDDNSTAFASWADMYEKAGATANDPATGAKPERIAADKGQNASIELAKLKAAVETAIGANTDGENKPGLRIAVETAGADEKTADTFEWSAYLLDVANTYPAVTGPGANDTTFANTTKPTSDDITDADLTADGGTTVLTTTIMTLDNMDEPRFADKGFATTDNGNTNQFGTAVNFNEPDAPFVAGTDTTLSQKWEALKVLLQRKELLNQKIKLIDANANGSRTSVARKGTYASGNVEYIEGSVYKAMLQEQMAQVDELIKTAKSEYDTEAGKVITMISKMNELQDLVDTANAQYNTLFGESKVGTGTYTTKPAIADQTAWTVPNYTDDTKTEKKLHERLLAVYGIALKDDSATAGYNKMYTDPDCAMGHASSTNVEATYLTTYSESVTKDTIDGDLTTNDNGTIKWKDTTVLSADDKTAVGTTASSVNSHTGSLYHQYKAAEFMKAKRKTEADTAKTNYDNLITQKQLITAEQALASKDIKLFVNLDNIGDGTAKDKWQPVGFTNTDKGTDFIFGYTGILESGEVSKNLIKSVYLDDQLEQHDFIDLTFDLNVEAESAQVVYNGTKVQSTAAKASLTGAQPTADQYEDSENAIVAWEAKTAVANPAIDDDDPNPKADADVTPAAPNP